MDWQILEAWLSSANLFVIAVCLFAALCAAAVAGAMLHDYRRGKRGADADAESGQEGYIVSAVLGLLALLLGFTFSMAVDRFDARRFLVLEEANAIGTTYLRAQLLPEPHRARITHILVQYTDNRLVLAKAASGSPAQQASLRVNDALITDLWAATSAAFDSVKTLDFSSVFLSSVNTVIDLDASRKMARVTRVPTEVFGVLIIFLVATAAVLGYVLRGMQSRREAGLLLALLTLSLILIIDINRPLLGGVSESQRPMEDLRAALAARPPAVFDKWRSPDSPGVGQR
ncbi:hypothetical protein ASD38_11570 [Caulobacter sp. Root487D2Y]|uniref:bestrophin-like domain n=1 Tax=Caulobacter sp. Root487D2Y TaxID=1736547 RepID=UPI0006FF89C6|nr:hypothetical protein [Caulobacter sp. Root487D2Y]KQY29945.1 hypothetical protein ASD38_11570 [Caulobacter sp. Root487D2Y]